MCYSMPKIIINKIELTTLTELASLGPFVIRQSNCLAVSNKTAQGTAESVAATNLLHTDFLCISKCSTSYD